MGWDLNPSSNGASQRTPQAKQERRIERNLKGKIAQQKKSK